MLLIVLALTWGSSFILMKLGMEDRAGNPVYTSEEVAALRISTAFLFLLPFGIYYLPTLKRKKIVPLLVSGLFGNTIPAFLFTAAETRMEPSLAGMLNSTTPIFTILIAIGFFGERFRPINYLGVALGFAGSAGLMLANGTAQLSGELYYSMLVLIATLCYAISLNTIRRYLTDMHPIAVTSLSFMLVGPPVTLYLFSTGFSATFFHHPSGLTSFGYVLLLGVLGTAVAVILFNYLVQISNAVFASTVTYLIPITAIGWGLLLQESVNAYHFGAMLLILAGVYLINRP